MVEDETREEAGDEATAETPPVEEERPEMLETIEVRVGTVPGVIRTVVVNGGRTAGKALSGAGIGVYDGTEIRVNGRIAEADTPIVAGSTILAVQRITGN